MGKIKQGILGGFSGRVGTVIGVCSRGMAFMRARAMNIRNPRTEKQMAQRAKFELVQDFLSPMASLLRVGFRLYDQEQSAYNAAMSYALLNAVSGAYPNFALDHAAALISRGPLTPPVNALATATADSIQLSWADNSAVASAKQTDRALIAIINPAKGEAITYTEGAERVAGTQTVALWDHWAGDVVHCYLGFASEDGQKVSNSRYLGQITAGTAGNAGNPGAGGTGNTGGNTGGTGGGEEDLDPDA